MSPPRPPPPWCGFGVCAEPLARVAPSTQRRGTSHAGRCLPPGPPNCPVARGGRGGLLLGRLRGCRRRVGAGKGYQPARHGAAWRSSASIALGGVAFLCCCGGGGGGGASVFDAGPATARRQGSFQSVNRGVGRRRPSPSLLRPPLLRQLWVRVGIYMGRPRRKDFRWPLFLTGASPTTTAQGGRRECRR